MKTFKADRKCCTLRNNMEELKTGTGVHGIDVKLHIPGDDAPWYILDVGWTFAVVSRLHGSKTFQERRLYLVAGRVVDNFLPTVRPEKPRPQVYVDVMALGTALNFDRHLQDSKRQGEPGPGADYVSIKTYPFDERERRIRTPFPPAESVADAAVLSNVTLSLRDYIQTPYDGFYSAEHLILPMYRAVLSSLARDAYGWYHLIDPVFPIYWPDRLLPLVQSGVVSVIDKRHVHVSMSRSGRISAGGYWKEESGYVPTPGIPFMVSVRKEPLGSALEEAGKKKGLKFRLNNETTWDLMDDASILVSYASSIRDPSLYLLWNPKTSKPPGVPSGGPPFTSPIPLRPGANVRRVASLISQLASSDVLSGAKAFLALNVESINLVPCALRFRPCDDGLSGRKEQAASARGGSVEVSFLRIEVGTNYSVGDWKRSGFKPLPRHRAHSLGDSAKTPSVALPVESSGSRFRKASEGIVREFIRMFLRRAREVEQEIRGLRWEWVLGLRLGSIVTLPVGDPPRVMIRRNVADSLGKRLMEEGKPVEGLDLDTALQWTDLGPLRDDPDLIEKILSLPRDVVVVGYPLVAFPWRRTYLLSEEEEKKPVRSNANVGVILLNIERKILLADNARLVESSTKRYRRLAIESGDIVYSGKEKYLLEPILVSTESSQEGADFPKYNVLKLKKDARDALLEGLDRVRQVWEESNLVILRGLSFAGDNA